MAVPLGNLGSASRTLEFRTPKKEAPPEEAFSLQSPLGVLMQQMQALSREQASLNQKLLSTGEELASLREENRSLQYKVDNQARENLALHVRNESCETRLASQEEALSQMRDLAESATKAARAAEDAQLTTQEGVLRLQKENFELRRALQVERVVRLKYELLALREHLEQLQGEKPKKVEEILESAFATGLFVGSKLGPLAGFGAYAGALIGGFGADDSTIDQKISKVQERIEKRKRQISKLELTLRTGEAVDS